MLARLAFTFSFILLSLVSLSARADSYEVLRNQMVELIKKDVAETSRFINKSALDSRVLEVLRKVPRHEFVPLAKQPFAYQNRPLPIGHGQTISQPYIVALMSDLVQVQPGHVILEIGTGSGYQAAVLADLGAEVHTIEIIKPLFLQAKSRIEDLGYDKVSATHGDGYYGLQSHAPFDAIVVTAAASHVPPPLVKQLKPGGRMIIPVGSRFSVQQLLLVEKSKQGTVSTRQILPVRFVPLTGKH